jgi:hypothetical protein
VDHGYSYSFFRNEILHPTVDYDDPAVMAEAVSATREIELYDSNGNIIEGIR